LLGILLRTRVNSFGSRRFGDDLSMSKFMASALVCGLNTPHWKIILQPSKPKDFHLRHLRPGDWKPFFPKYIPRCIDGKFYWRKPIFRRPLWDDYLEEGPVYEYAVETY
jgi:hypothetical protein